MFAYLYPACCVQNQLASVIKYSAIKYSSAPTSPGKILQLQSCFIYHLQIHVKQLSYSYIKFYTLVVLFGPRLPSIPKTWLNKGLPGIDLLYNV